MLTRCPACATHFRVSPEQLRVRSGRVRCGNCQQAFNALDSLIEEPLRMAAALVPATPQACAEAEPSAIEMGTTAHDESPVDEVITPAPISQPAEQAPEESAAPTPEAEDRSNQEAAEAAAAVEPDMPTESDTRAETGTDLPDWSATFPAPPPKPRRWPWVIGSLVALAAIGLQAVLAFRVELAVLWPEARPTLIALCRFTGCEVGLPTKVALVGIEASDLHPDRDHAGRLTLTATLKNRAPFAQQLPHLELTLTDTADKAIARKVLAPADYLPPRASLAAGMPPNTDITVAVGVDPGEMTASGYRLYVFYP